MRSELRHTLRLAFPMVVAQLALFGQLVIESVLAGHLDGETLGAVALGGSISFLANIICSGLMLAVPPTVAQLDGAGRRGEVAAVFRQAVLLALAAGAVLGAAVGFGGPVLVAGLGTAPGPRGGGRAVPASQRARLPAVALFFACRGASEGLSMPRPTVTISAVSLLALAPLGYVLMYGALGLPAAGSGRGPRRHAGFVG